MPGTFQALVVFALFVVPGFLLRAGYLKSRAHGAAQVDLYALAEAVVASLFVLAAASWWRGEDVLLWTTHGELESHRQTVYFFALTMLVAPFFVGLALGWLIDGVLAGVKSLRSTPEGKTRGAFSLLDASGLLQLPTVWDQAWSDLIGTSPLFVKIRTSSGHEIVGSFDSDSWVGLSPAPRQLYLSNVYRKNGSGTWAKVPGTKGVLVDASQLELLEFIVE